MKIRIQGNSIRYRLTKSEVATLCETGIVMEKTILLGSVFVYSIQKEENLDAMKATLKHNRITLSVPASKLHNWDNNEEVGFSETLLMSNNQKLFLLLEKDFACLDRREEDQSDQYDNPKAIL